MNTILLLAPGAQQAASALAAPLDAPCAKLESRRFPDGESYLRVHHDLAGHDVLAQAVRPFLPG